MVFDLMYHIGDPFFLKNHFPEPSVNIKVC